jgi:bifunctional oligoribonuclease and PAP phosphatase NrnA
MSKTKSVHDSIHEQIKQANKILLHCHPYPDPDSIESVLALARVLDQMGKEVTAIGGDTAYPEYLNNLPGHKLIQQIEYSKVNKEDYDLFIILDSSSPSQITQNEEVKFPASMKTIVIDHHSTNEGFGNINLINASKSSTCEILYELFRDWGVKIDSNIALYLLLGIYADTGAFKYPNTKPETLKVFSELVSIHPDYHKYVFRLDNNRQPIELEMTKLALESIEQHYGGRVTFSAVPYEEIKTRELSKSDALEGLIGDMLRSVVGWTVVASLVEVEPNEVVISLRTRDEEKYDVSSIAKAVGENGGGHPGAAGTTIRASLIDAKKLLLGKIIDIYPDLP